MDQPALKTILKRGWRKKCPQCGQGALFKKGIDLYDNCANCDLQYLRNRGDYWGFLLVIDRAMFVLPLIVIIYLDLLPRTDWTIALFFVGVMGLFIATSSRRYGLCVGLDFFSRRYWG